MQKLIPSIQRLFQSTEYRIFNPYLESDTQSENLVFFSKRSHHLEIGNNVTYIKPKITLIRAAAVKANLTYLEAYETDKYFHFSDNTNQISILQVLPRELILHILNYTSTRDVINFAKTSRVGRLYAYDNMLWKSLSSEVWKDPYYMHVNITSSGSNLKLWYNRNANKRYSTEQVIWLFQQNWWRIIYIALTSLDLIPSLIYPLTPIFNRRITQCFASSRFVNYTSSVGRFKLKGVEQVTRVEFAVFNYAMRPWYRKEYVNFMPIAIFGLRDYGLKMARSPRGQHTRGFFQRRGSYLKTDENRKIHLTYRYFPTMRFRLFKQGEKIFLLCQDLYLTGGESTECYTMYEIIKKETTANNSDDLASNSDDEIDERITTEEQVDVQTSLEGTIESQSFSSNTSNSLLDLVTQLSADTIISLQSETDNNIQLAQNERIILTINGNNISMTNENNISTTNENNISTSNGNNILTTNERTFLPTTERIISATNGNNISTANENNISTTNENNTSTSDENNISTTIERSFLTTNENNISTTNENNISILNENMEESDIELIDLE